MRKEKNKMSKESITVKPEWPMAIHDVVRILMNRGYLRRPEDVKIVRPGYDSILPCGSGSPEGPLKLNQLSWAAEKGKFYFCWYVGSYLSLSLNKGVFSKEAILDPTKQNVWEFVREVDQTFK
jgi:hypothetical protein